jgi:KaiC/GvpD/RAD55 family RecA-like ATPase
MQNFDIDRYLVKFEDIPYERKSIERVLTGFPDLDYFNKGIECGLTEVLGGTNVGKSVFTSSLIKSAISQHYKVGVFAGEHSLKSYKALVMQQNATKGEFECIPFIDNNGKETNIADWYVNDESEQRINNMYNGNMFLFDVRRPERNVDTMVNVIKNAKEKYGVRFWIIDNLMEIDNKSNNQWQEQTDIGNQLRNVFVQNDLFGILVMHINKTKSLRVSIRDAFGSSNVTNKAYRIWVIYRKDVLYPTKDQEKELEYIKEDLLKNGFDYDKCDGFIDTVKSKGNGNGIIGIKYNPDTKTYTQADKISKTEADKIFKAKTKTVTKQIDIEALNEISDDELDFLPF